MARVERTVSKKVSGAKAGGDWLTVTEGEAGAGAAPGGVRCSSVNTLRRARHLGDPGCVEG